MTKSFVIFNKNGTVSKAIKELAHDEGIVNRFKTVRDYASHEKVDISNSELIN